MRRGARTNMALTSLHYRVGDCMLIAGERAEFISWTHRDGLNFQPHAWRLVTQRRGGQCDFRIRPAIKRGWRWRLPTTLLGGEFWIRVPSGRVERIQRR